MPLHALTCDDVRFADHFPDAFYGQNNKIRETLNNLILKVRVLLRVVVQCTTNTSSFFSPPLYPLSLVFAVAPGLADRRGAALCAHRRDNGGVG